jgi:threonine dehydrogenase-like Zn-dependent dehydrogenase
MRCLWLEDQTLTFRDDVPAPAPGPGEALVRVEVAGVCGTDVELLRGYYPYTGVPGHEFVGRVEAAPDDPGRVGQRVVGEINAACGRCDTCRAGRRTHCERRTVLGIVGRDGAMAELLCLPMENLLEVPAQVASDAAVFCEPLAAAVQVLAQVHVSPSDRVLVLGAGRLGQLLAQVLSLTGCHLRVVARHAAQRHLLQQRKIPLLDGEVTAGCADVVVEATGAPDGFDLARRAVRPRGTVVLKSTYARELSVDVSSVVVDELTLVASRCGPFAPALRLLQQGHVDPSPLIQARYPLEQGVEAVAHADRPGVLKVLVEM